MARRRRRPGCRCTTPSGRTRASGTAGTSSAGACRSRRARAAPAARAGRRRAASRDANPRSALEEALGVGRPRVDSSRRRARRVRSFRSTRPLSASSTIFSASASASASAGATASARTPISSRIVRSVREAMIGSAIPSTQTRSDGRRRARRRSGARARRSGRRAPTCRTRGTPSGPPQRRIIPHARDGTRGHRSPSVASRIASQPAVRSGGRRSARASRPTPASRAARSTHPGVRSRGRTRASATGRRAAAPAGGRESSSATSASTTPPIPWWKPTWTAARPSSRSAGISSPMKTSPGK